MSSAPSCIVIGGSNSLLKDGWVDHLKQLHPNQVINLSIGAATTAMGLFRLLTRKDLPERPVIIWEYSLNEANYFAHRQPAPVLLYHTAWLFELCARRGYPVLPVLLYNRAEAAGDERNAYRPLLDELLANYCLTCVDAQELWKVSFSHLEVNQLYKDNPHYATTTQFLSALACKVLDQLHLARVPAPSIEGHKFSGLDLEIVTPEATETKPVSFSNRILDCNIYPLRETLQAKMQGNLLACYLISSEGEPAIEFATETGKIGPYSAQISPKDGGPQRQLKHLLLWSPKQPPLMARDKLTITSKQSWMHKPAIQHTMAWKVPSADAGTGGLIGLLVERST